MNSIVHPPRDSVFDTLLDWIRRRKMTDWLKIGVGAAGAVVVAWTMIQQHEYRLGQIEEGFRTHIVEYNAQYRDISKTLHDIDVSLARMATKPLDTPRATAQAWVPQREARENQ